MIIIPNNLEFIGQKNYTVIFRTSLSKNADCNTKCLVEINLTNLTTGNINYYNFIIPDNSQTCCEDCDSIVRVGNEFTTSVVFNEVIIGDRYRLIATINCLDLTPTPSVTPTQTVTPTISISQSPTLTPTISETPTQTPTNTQTPTISISQSPTETPTNTPTQTPTPTLTNTPTSTNTPAIMSVLIPDMTSNTTPSGVVTITGNTPQLDYRILTSAGVTTGISTLVVGDGQGLPVLTYDFGFLNTIYGFSIKGGTDSSTYPLRRYQILGSLDGNLFDLLYDSQTISEAFQFYGAGSNYWMSRSGNDDDGFQETVFTKEIFFYSAVTYRYYRLSVLEGQSNYAVIGKFQVINTAAPTPTPTLTNTPTQTPTPTLTNTPTQTPAPSLTNTPTQTQTPTRTPVSATVPGPPTGLNMFRASCGMATFWWIAPTSDGGSPILGYKLRGSTDGYSATTTIAGNVTSTTITGPPGMQGNSYTFRLWAYNAIGESATYAEGIQTDDNNNGFAGGC